MLLGSLSRHNDDLEPFGTLKPLARHSSLRSWTNRVIALRQISVTALFYLEDSRRIHPWRREEWRRAPVVGGGGSRGGGSRERERAKAGETERESAWLLLLYVFLPLGLPYANWAQPGVLFYLKSSLRPRTFLWPSFVLFLQAFPFLVF